MFKALIVTGILLSCLNVLADVPETFVGAVRCSATFYERNLAKGDISESKVADILLVKKGYNSWRLASPVVISNSDGYIVTLTSVAVSSTRMNPQDMRLFFNARLSKKIQESEKVLAIGLSEEKDSNNSLGLLSTEEEQVSVDSGTRDTTALIKSKALPDNYVRSASVSCFMTYNK